VETHSLAEPHSSLDQSNPSILQPQRAKFQNHCEQTSIRTANISIYDGGCFLNYFYLLTANYLVMSCEISDYDTTAILGTRQKLNVF
jgi:hypothetical protein